MIRKAVTPPGEEVPKLMDAKVEKPIKVAFVCMFEGWTSSQRMMDFLNACTLNGYGSRVKDSYLTLGLPDEEFRKASCDADFLVMAIPSPEFKKRFDAKLDSVFGEAKPRVIYTHDWSKDERYGTKFGGRVLSEILKIRPLK